MDIVLIPRHVAAVLPYDKGVGQRAVGIQKQDLAHILGGQAHYNGQAVFPVRHGIFAGHAKEDDVLPAAVHGRFALPASQTLQKGLRVVERHRIAIDHLNFAVGGVQGGAHEMPGLGAVLNLRQRAAAGISFAARRDMGDGLRHGQAEVDDCFKMQGNLLAHTIHVGCAYCFNGVFAHLFDRNPQKGKHKNIQADNQGYAAFQGAWKSHFVHLHSRVFGSCAACAPAGTSRPFHAPVSPENGL